MFPKCSRTDEELRGNFGKQDVGQKPGKQRVRNKLINIIRIIMISGASVNEHMKVSFMLLFQV